MGRQPDGAPASFTFKDLQNLQELGPASLKDAGAMLAPSGISHSLQLDGSGDMNTSTYGDMPGSSPMFKFGSPSPMKGQVKSEFDQWHLPHTGLTPTAGAQQAMQPGQPGVAQQPGAPGAMPGQYPGYAGAPQQGYPGAQVGHPGAGYVQQQQHQQHQQQHQHQQHQHQHQQQQQQAAVPGGHQIPGPGMPGYGNEQDDGGASGRGRRKRAASTELEQSAAVSNKSKYTHDEAMAVLNRKGGPVSEDDLSRIDPSTLSQDDVKKLKKLRRAIRNRESATASRLRRKEYIENLEKRMSELSSQNTLLNISVTEMQMREKDKREEEERIRLENERLRADTEATRIANQKLREEKLYMQQVSEKLQAFKFSHPSAPSSGGKDDELVEPPTWPPPRQKTPVLVFRQ
jgi:hypothetical protein